VKAKKEGIENLSNISERSLDMERSLVLIKPDAMQRGLAGTIISRFQGNGLKLIALKMLHMDKALAERHYAIHAGKPFFKDLVNYITSTPIIATVFEAEGAVDRIRKLMGATDPARAEPGTIRKDFGLDIQQNAVHGSDSTETARKEIELFFTESEIFDY
jgi:nucleoside-diphosphate kinase